MESTKTSSPESSWIWVDKRRRVCAFMNASVANPPRGFLVQPPFQHPIRLPLELLASERQKRCRVFLHRADRDVVLLSDALVLAVARDLKLHWSDTSGRQPTRQHAHTRSCKLYPACSNTCCTFSLKESCFGPAAAPTADKSDKK